MEGVRIFMTNEELEKQAEILNLETLITSGTETIIPITIEYMGKQFSANIRPINSIENNNAVQRYMKNQESIALNTVKHALLKDDGSTYTLEELKKIPSGVVDKIYEKITEVSGIETDNNSVDQEFIINKLMGF